MKFWKSWLSLKGVTITVGFVLFCFGVRICIRGDGNSTAAASYTFGDVTASEVTCVNWKEITNPSKLFGCGPDRDDAGRTYSVNLGLNPVVWNVMKDAKGRYHTSAGLGTTVSTGNVGASVAITKELYTYYPEQVPRASNNRLVSDSAISPLAKPQRNCSSLRCQSLKCCLDP